MEAPIERWKRAGPKRASLPASKASSPIAPLKPNEMQHPKELRLRSFGQFQTKARSLERAFNQNRPGNRLTCNIRW